MKHRFTTIVAILGLLPVLVAFLATNHSAALQRRSIAQAQKYVERLELYDRLGTSLRNPNDTEFQSILQKARTGVSTESRPFVLEQLHVLENARPVLLATPRNEQHARELAAQAMIALRQRTRAEQMAAIRTGAAELQQVKVYESLMLVFSLLAICGFVVSRNRTMEERVVAAGRARRLEELQRRNDALEGAIEGVATFDTRGQYTWVNSNFARIVGYDPEELIGSDIRFSLVNLAPESLADAETELRATGRTACDVSVRRKDGSVAHLHVVMIARRSMDGGYVFVEDVTVRKNTEAALRLSDERFSLAMQATRDIVSDWDLLTNEVWVNDGLQMNLGYPEGMKLTCDEVNALIHPDDAQRVMTTLHEAMNDAHSEGVSDEFRVRRHDGTYAYVFARCRLLRDDEGRALRMICAATDITSRREQLEEIERLGAQKKMILSSTADGLFGVDAEGRTTFVNPAATHILGWTARDLEGKVLHDLVHRSADGGPVSIEECSIERALRECQSVNGKGTYWTKDGRSVQVEFTSQPMQSSDGEVVGAVVTFRDITERLVVEKMKDEFISVVSHELRTPLTSIRGALGLMAGGRVADVPEKMKRMLDIAVSNTDRLVRLINDILDIERIDSGKITLNRSLCKSADAIEDAVESMKPLADAAGVRIESDTTQGVLFADRDRLQQTLTNLIGNAIKFSPRGTTVNVSATMSGTDVRFCVEDRGRGIPHDKLKTIFERFQQVDATDSREKGGSGLGLAICRSIVRQHGGEIWAESELGQGSCFIFTLPRVQRAKSSLPAAASARTVVVCEDDDIVREVELELLEQAGYRAVGFPTAGELLASTEAASANVILLDMGLPDLRGLEVVKRLRQRHETRDVPVVIVSGELPDSAVAEISAWLCKPLQESELLRGVEAAIRPSPRKPRVLLVEDDLDLAHIIIESFDRLGIESFHAATGREAVELAREFQPELIVLDLVLPEMDGYAVVADLRAHERLSRAPLIVYSAAEPGLDDRDRLRLGPTEFFTKSRISPDEFERHVVRLLDHIVGPRKELSHVA